MKYILLFIAAAQAIKLGLPDDGVVGHAATMAEAARIEKMRKEGIKEGAQRTKDWIEKYEPRGVSEKFGDVAPGWYKYGTMRD